MMYNPLQVGQDQLTYMTTHAGRRVSFLDPRPEDIDIEDIAWHLSMQCRYAGGTTKFYSVAEHCVHVAYAVPFEDAFVGLLHDAPEAYLTDIPRGLKNLLPDYQRIEARFWEVIRNVFNLPALFPASVTDVDTRILLNERDAVFPTFVPNGALFTVPQPVDRIMILGLPQHEAYNLFLGMFETLSQTR
jgi:hypothetical protein